jgi:hypothetical protein
MSEAKVTTDHKSIRKWAEARGGRPATVEGTGKRDDADLLRLDFGPKDESLDPISWEEFFDKFESAHLAFLYQDKTSDGSVSRFHKFVDRNAQHAEHSSHGRGSHKTHA